MAEFVRHNRVVLTCGVLLLVSLLLASVSGGRPGQRDPVAALVLDAMAPVQRAVAAGAGMLDDAWNSYVAVTAAARENLRLRRTLRLREAERMELLEARLEVKRLRRLLELRDTIPGRTYAARVIGQAPGPWFRGLLLGIGSRDGVREGMAVIAPEGAVGRVARAGRRAALVLLLTDPRSGIDALVQRTRARGIVRGAGADGCVLRYVERENDVQPGDVVLTSGLDGIFPKGVPIGTITRVIREEQGLLLAAQIRPAADLGRVEEALVIDRPALEPLPLETPAQALGESAG